MKTKQHKYKIKIKFRSDSGKLKQLTITTHISKERDVFNWLRVFGLNYEHKIDNDVSLTVTQL